MFNKKKWLLLLLTATLVCVSAGCGNETATSSSPSSAPGASSSNQGESTTIPTQPETTAAVESTPSSSAAETTAPPAPTTTTEAPPPPTTTAPTASGMAAGEKATSQTVEFTMLSARKDPNNSSRYLVTFTLKNLDALEHPYTYAQRLHLLAADKTRIPASSLSADGVDLNGKSLASGDSITAEAVFTLPEGFQPVNFTYTYDIMGFGIFTYRLDG